jgi:hypothetical protein
MQICFSKLSWCEHQKLGDLVLSLNLDTQEVHSLLKVLFKLDQKFWTPTDGKSLPGDLSNSVEMYVSNFSILVCLLTSLLKRILLLRDEDNQEDSAAIPLNEGEMSSCLAVYENILQNLQTKNVELKKFESTLLEYLTTYPHHVKTFSSGKLLLIKRVLFLQYNTQTKSQFFRPCCQHFE